MNPVWMFTIFFIVVFSVFSLMQYRLYRLFRSWLRRSFEGLQRKRWERGGKLALIGFNLLLLMQIPVRMGSFYDFMPIQILIVYPAGLFFATVVFAFLIVTVADVVCLMTDGVRLIFHRSPKTRAGYAELPLSNGRREFLRKGGMGAAAVVGSFPLVASIATARDYQINRITMPFKEFPPELNGLTIAHVSDLHSGLYMTENNMREIFDIVNGLSADFVLMTGDFVDSADSQIEPLVNALKTLHMRAPVYGCLGNHDHFATVEKVSAALERSGVVLLNNSSERIVMNNRDVMLVGIDDAGRGAANFARFDTAMRHVEPDVFKIMLTHRPDVWDECRERGIHLTLAGHTHGGQVGFRLGPLNLNPVYLVHKYAMGEYVEQDRRLYVNVGVGMVGVPIRMVKPEIALVTLETS
ncbi:MAG: metallophosphoesterase [Ignavibacteriales bacterium]|nr:metallophosphoesterase [Ignavibacteriales bacterium]